MFQNTAALLLSPLLKTCTVTEARNFLKPYEQINLTVDLFLQVATLYGYKIG